MCDRCSFIDRQLWNYRELRMSLDDTLALSLLSATIADLETEKANLHLENDKRGEDER